MKKIIVPKSKNRKEQTFCTLCNAIDMKAHKAAMLGHIPCLELANRQKPKLFKLNDANGATPIHLAARENQIRAFRWILTNTELTICERANNGETPSHVAAAQGNLDMLKLIINYDLNKRIEAATVYDNLGFTPLKLAILRDHPSILEWLLEEFGTAAFGDPNKSEESDVHICAALGHLACLKVLLKYSPSLANLTVDDGTTPVYYAAQEGRLNVLEHLVGTLGCSLGMRAKDGMMALHAASQNGHTRVVKYLIEHQGKEAILGQTGDGATPIHFASSKGHVDTLRWLLDHDTSGTGVKVTDEVGGTPAHDAADNGELECLTLLVERGASIFAEDLNKATPYILGLESGNDDVKSYLRKLAMSLGKLPGSKAPSARGSRRGSNIVLETRDDGEGPVTLTREGEDREADEVRTARVSFDAMKYATQVQEKLREAPKDSETESEQQPDSPEALSTLQEIPSKESMETESIEKKSTPSVLEEETKETSTQRSGRRSQQGELLKTPSLYTSQDLSGDDFFDLDKLEKEIDELNKQFNEMQFTWQKTVTTLDPPAEADTPSRRESRHILKNVIPQFAPIHSPPVDKKDINETQIQQIEIEFPTETGPASSRRELSRNLKKKHGEGIPGISDYLEEPSSPSDDGTMTPEDSEDSVHSSQVDLNEHPLLPISEEISPYEPKKGKQHQEPIILTQRTSFVGEISQAEVRLEKELTEEQLKERSGKGKFVIFSDTEPKERRPISTGQTLEGFDVGQLSDEALMGLYARMDPSKKRQVLEALIQEAKEADETEDLQKENEIVQGLKARAKVATVKTNEMKILKLLILFILFHSSNSACPRPDPLQNGTSFGCLSEGGQYQFFCDQGYSIRGPITRLCVNGDWSGTQPTCEISLGGELSEGDVRFDPEYQIIPNFNYQGTFYRSCWNDYSIDFANLLCYVAGRVGAVSVHRIDLDFGIEVSGPYVTADNITCVGNEEHFSECTFGSIEISPDCSDGVLGISCFPYATMTHDFTLDRIRMYYDNDTLDVCSNSIDQQTADIYCKLLGKLGGATMTSVNATQVGSEVVTKVVCLPSMRNFGDCVVTLNDSCVDGFMKIECRETDVENSLRLTGAVDLHTGKLQIYKAGSWGDICWEAFYSTEAEVACRQLGFETFLAAPKGIYGDREGDSYAVERVKCPVDATNYSSCQFLTESRCNDPDEAVSIWCINRTGCCIPFNNSSLLRTNSTKPGLIPHGEVLRYSCIGNSVVSGSSELMCEGGIWSSVPPQCIDATENSIRLIDGSSAKEGNIQIFQNGKWNFVCDRNWDLEVGTRKCEDLGYEGALEVTKFNYFNSTSGQQNSSLECNITNCTTQSDCAISEAAGVICGNLQFEVRLVGPNSNETAGRVQVFFNGAWIEVCQRYLSIFSRVGPTVCNQLGYTFNSEYDHEDRSEIYGEPVGNTTIDLLCLGDNDNIGECSHSISECDNQGLYLVCTPPETGTIRLVGSDNPYEGIVEIYQEYSWKSICQQNWDDTDGRIVCKELGWDYLQNIGTNYGPAVSPIGFGITNVGCYGNETTLSECPYLTDTSDCDRGNPATVTCGIPSQFQVQLRDTTDNINNISGRVVVYVDRNWIGVCDDDWGFPDALVVCRSLGYNFTINAIAGYSTITADRGWNYVNCVGNETSFGDCEYRNTTVSSFFFASCYRSEGAGVTCGNYVDYDIKIREDTLKIGDLITGIVEIRYEGEWYPICSKNDNISEYLCEVLGYGNASVPITSSEEIITDFSFNNFTCTGDQSISQCLPEPGPKVDCPSGKPVQISCINNDGRVRLLDGNKTAGHVQIFHAGRWGDVCDDLWGIEDANVVCRQLFQRGALKAIL
ncbi:Deleted in malignant brain tumors 1 protein-like isoform X2 [Oopsacas minuta]|uniref:Deleted in malignant brain tumors 1 protein-like isoform X2 n=1 Tax=Oopsacas minuta TaxID=111878 RepID=A0AAV7JWV3_9METZ|nr:Deleted in malignant brain tumors 1 protein-like isoform X2 [Oopsacas minuta]